MRPLPARRGRAAQRGVTLIELMIAVSLTAVITVGLLFALRTSVLAYEKTGNRLRSNREHIGRNQILANELGGAMPISMTCTGAGELPFFTGTPATLRMVSSYSIAEGFRGYPQILEFRVTPSPSDGARLTVTERPYTGPASVSVFCGATEANDVEGLPGGSPPFVLAEGLSSCEFFYHEPVNMLALIDTAWLPMWNGPRLPSGVRVVLQARAGAGGALPAVNVTVPLRTDRDETQQYGDF